MAMSRSPARVVMMALVASVGGLTWMTGNAERAPYADGALADAYDADSWFTLQRAYPSGRVPPAGALQRAVHEASGRSGPRTQLTLPDDRWVPIGPAPIFVQNNLPWVGRVTAVAPHPTNANILYLGADAGGIWRTTDGGQSWVSLTDAFAVPAIASLAIDPVNPNLLYATTIPRTYPIRLLRSVDGGQSWSESPIVTERGELSPVRCSVNVFKACIPPSSGRIFLDPQRSGSAASSRVYFTASSHLFRSDDSGRTFRRVLTLGTDLDFAGSNAPTLNPEAEFLRDAVVDPVRPERLIAAVAQPRCLDAACGTATTVIVVYRSTDGGERWSRQEIGSLDPYPLENTRYADPGAVYVPRVRLAIAPSSVDVVGLAFRDEVLRQPRVFRSTNGGEDWAETAPAATSLTWPLALAFSPTNPDVMYVGSSGVHKTTNGGATWQTMRATHVDNIALVFDAGGALIVGNDGGIFRATPDETNFTSLNAGLPITEFYSVAAHPSNPLLIAGGTQDNGTVIFQGSLGWSLITGGDGGDVVFDPNPQARTLYVEVEWFFIGPNNTFQFFRCQPGGCVTRSNGINRSVPGPFIPRIAMDPQNSSTLWLTAGHLFRTDNRADTWTAASPLVTNTERCWQEPGAGLSCAPARYFTAVAIAPSDSQTVYAGTLNGDVWMSTDRGATWRSIAGDRAGPLPVRAVNDIIVDPRSARTVYVAYSGFDANGTGNGRVFRTTDAGETWIDLSGNLPDMPVNTLLLDPEATLFSPRVLYAGTDVGVFRMTFDGTTTWQPFGTGLPPVVVNRIAYNAATRQLLAATYGRGIWAISSRFER